MPVGADGRVLRGGRDGGGARPVDDGRLREGGRLRSGRGNRRLARGRTLLADTTGFPGRVPGSTPPQILVAALGPATLGVTGELADGTITWLAGPRTLEQHIVPTLSAASRGRTSPRSVASLPVCVTNNPDDVTRRASAHLAMYDQFSAYAAVLQREGAQKVGELAIIGDEAVVEKQIKRLQDAGAAEFIATHGGSPRSKSTTTRPACWGACPAQGPPDRKRLTSNAARPTWCRHR
jgi:alkanesulfonate monooxygenase SsuD/methylene tetrahydromethanopterin reductase-like flavin-dependent oxidoreductase (luciferase family)